MAHSIVIKDVYPWDGDYEFDVVGHPLTTKEWGWVKRHAGYLPDTVDDGLTDPETITVFSVIALRRAGKIDDRDVAEVYDHLSDQPFGQGKITLKLDTPEKKEDEASPPEQSSSSNDDTTGLESNKSSEISLVHPKRSGTSDSDSSESDQERSAI